MKPDENTTGIKLIAIHGGNRQTVDICARAGWYYGIQFGYTCYGLPYMTDYIGDGGDWDNYINMLKSHRPRQALVADFRRDDEWRDVTGRMRDVAELGIRPVVVSKFPYAMRLIPEYTLGIKTIVAVSVPTRRGYMNDGTLPTRDEFERHSAHFYDSKYAGGLRDIHLLGGQPDQWAWFIKYYAGVANIYSIDGNTLIEQARQYGKVWSSHGYYHEMRGTRYSTQVKAIASMRNARRFLARGFYYPSSRTELCQQSMNLIPTQERLFA